MRGNNFSLLTGGNTTGGISGWNISDLSINGNKANNPSSGLGIRVYGYEYQLDNVGIYLTKDVGLYSEWNTGLTSPWPNSMEAHVTVLRVHDNDSDGIVWAGPHDSNWSNVESYSNSGKGVWFKSGADGTSVVNGHSYGNSQAAYPVDSGLSICSGYAGLMG